MALDKSTAHGFLEGVCGYGYDLSEITEAVYTILWIIFPLYLNKSHFFAPATD